MSASGDVETVRLRLTYSGRVQGVMFRATSEHFAKRHPIGGWVRNNDDGTVGMEVQGPRHEVEAFLQRIEQHFSANIAGVDREELAPGGELRRFAIIY